MFEPICFANVFDSYIIELLRKFIIQVNNKTFNRACSRPRAYDHEYYSDRIQIINRFDSNLILVICLMNIIQVELELIIFFFFTFGLFHYFIILIYSTNKSNEKNRKKYKFKPNSHAKVKDHFNAQYIVISNIVFIVILSNIIVLP